MFKQLQKSRRAISAIFATLIILAVVTVLFVPVFIWATGMTNQNQYSWQQSGITATERVVIEAVAFNNTDSTANLAENLQKVQNCTIYVRNIGDTTVTISNVVISTDSGKMKAYQKIPIPTLPAPAPTFSPVPQELSTIIPLSTPALDQSNRPTVAKGDLLTIRLPKLSGTQSGTSGFRIVEDQMYTIKVTTTRGVSDTYQILASKVG